MEIANVLQFIDTHAHLDGEDFKNDLPEVIQRAKDAGIAKIFLPSIDLNSVDSVLKVCQDYSGYTYPMIGLQPEEVKEDYVDVLRQMKKSLMILLLMEKNLPLLLLAKSVLIFIGVVNMKKNSSLLLKKK